MHCQTRQGNLFLLPFWTVSAMQGPCPGQVLFLWLHYNQNNHAYERRRMFVEFLIFAYSSPHPLEPHKGRIWRRLNGFCLLEIKYRTLCHISKIWYSSVLVGQMPVEYSKTVTLFLDNKVSFQFKVFEYGVFILPTPHHCKSQQGRTCWLLW